MKYEALVDMLYHINHKMLQIFQKKKFQTCADCHHLHPSRNAKAIWEYFSKQLQQSDLYFDETLTNMP